jgi:uncharacterized membrane protein
MSTLSVLRFLTVDGAQRMEDSLRDLQSARQIELQDAAIVTWPQGKRTPVAEQLLSFAGPEALPGAFWDTLLGLIFCIPIFGQVPGASVDTLSAKLVDYGIDDNFILQTRQVVTEGASAMFLLTSSAVQEAVVVAMRGQTFELLSTNIPKKREDELRAAFSAA